MTSRTAVLLVLLLVAPCVAAETVYKYRRADGKTVYSNRPIRGLELIETFEYKAVEPAPPSAAAAKSDAEGEARIKKYLDELQSAWTEVQEATRALARAEARLRAGVGPQSGDREGVATSALPPPVAGKPPPTQPPVGVAPPASPAVGGSMSGRRGRASPEYVARIEALEAEVATARTRLDAALRKYNQLR